MRRVAARCLGVAAVVIGLHCNKQSIDDDSVSSVRTQGQAPHFVVRVDSDPARVARGRRSRFLISILRQPGNRPADFPEDEADPVHFVIVRSDLGTFTHTHPRRASDGRFAAEAVLPTDGTYWLFTYFRAVNAEPASTRSELRVGARSTPVRPLEVTTRDRNLGPYEVAMTTSPDPPSSYEWTSINFHVMYRGQPVHDVEPAGGHLVILPESGNPFVFAHSTLGEAVGGMRAVLHAPAVPEGIGLEHYSRPEPGPDVQFHTRFPGPGRYKIWGEFTVGRDRIIADFVVNVV